MVQDVQNCKNSCAFSFFFFSGLGCDLWLSPASFVLAVHTQARVGGGRWGLGRAFILLGRLLSRRPIAFNGGVPPH